MLYNFSLRIKLLSLAGIGLLGLLVMGWIGWSSMNAIYVNAETLDTAHTRNGTLLTIENRAGSGAIFVERFLASPDIELASRAQENLTLGLQSLEDIQALGNTSQSAEVDTVAVSLGTLLGNLNQIIAQQEVVGFDEESGLQGTLRSSVREIESLIDEVDETYTIAGSLDALRVKMLMMRRHEKDFIMRRDEKYVGRLDDRVAEFQVLLADTSLPNAIKTSMNELLLAYQSSFHAWVEGSSVLQTTADEFRTVIAETEPVFALLSENARAGAFEAKDNMNTTQETNTLLMLISAMVILVVSVVASTLVIRSIAGTVSGIANGMKAVTEGNYETALPELQSGDEMQRLAEAAAQYRESARERVRLEQEQADQANIAGEEKRRTMNELADTFESSVNEVVSAVSSAAEHMVGLSQSLSQSAERAGERSTAVAAASEEASTNVETVAAASEEMTNSIAEVSKRIGESATMTDDAARGAEHTTQTVAKLSTSAQTIGEVISMISAIAEQTNLLALNATIEAARAGDAGKGFAVVASEVKSLANQTAKATEDISAQITGMQGDTDAVVEAIDKIGGMITELNSTSSSIAAAVEEQNSATQEIARNTLQAADGTREVSSNITDVSSAVQETGQAASEVRTASLQLASEAERLRENVADFLCNVRAA